MCQHNLPCSIVYAHCLLPGRAFASLYVLLFLEKEAEIGGRDLVTINYKRRSFGFNFPSDWFEHRYDFLMVTINADTDGMPQARPFTPHFIWYPLFEAVLLRADLGLRCLFA